MLVFFKEDGKSDLIYEMKNYFCPLKQSLLLLPRSESESRKYILILSGYCDSHDEH